MTKLERRLSELENWYKTTSAAGAADHYRAREILELARDILDEAKAWKDKYDELEDENRHAAWDRDLSI